MQKQRFSIDFLGEQTFEGYSIGEYWNGFACPYFTFDQAQTLVEAWRDSGKKASYNSTDLFIFEMQDGTIDTFSSTEIDGMKVYAIGNGCWIWSEAEYETSAR